jgi:hypothetical protein
METAIHRWDAEDAHGIARPFDRALARDGIDEMLAMFRDDPGYGDARDSRLGQKFLLHEDLEPARQGAAPGTVSSRWLVSFDHSGISCSPQEGPADVIVAGSASDLWLYIMGRRPPEEMHIEGDAGLAARWGDLAGRF